MENREISCNEKAWEREHCESEPFAATRLRRNRVGHRFQVKFTSTDVFKVSSGDVMRFSTSSSSRADGGNSHSVRNKMAVTAFGASTTRPNGRLSVP